LAVIFCLSIVGLFALVNVVQQSKFWIASSAVLSEANSRPQGVNDKINTPSKYGNRAAQIGDVSLREQKSIDFKKPVSQTALSVFSIPGCSVRINQDETRIVFDDGLFTFHCKLKKSAKGQLSTLARQLRENAPNCRIIIEGHTDSCPMPKNSPYRDNYALGLQRALVVAEVLKSHHQIAGGRILVTSMGDANPPFPEDDYESKLKNRTVVIRLF
jgi:outer membrane protein OmpA-like peptidoglycan-associated protein